MIYKKREKIKKVKNVIDIEENKREKSGFCKKNVKKAVSKN